MTTPIVFRPKWWVYEAIRDTTTKVFFTTGGLGSGKTDGFTTWHDHRVRLNPKSKFSWFFEPTHARIVDTAIPKYQKTLDRYGYVEGRHYRIVKNPFHKLIYYSGQEVHFHSFERPDLIVAVEISHATMDEAADAEFQAYMNVRSRIRCPGAYVRQLMCGGAPQGVNWLADIADSETLEGWNTSTPRDHIQEARKYRRFILWTDENADNLPEGYVEELEDTYGHNPNLIKSYRFGQFCPLTQRSAYSNYRQYNDIDDIECSPERDINLTFDFNANPVSWVAIQRMPFTEGYDRVFRYVGIHESDDKSTQLSDAVVDFAVKHPVALFRKTPIKLYGDRTGHAKSHKVEGSDFENIERYLRELGYQNIEIVAARQVAPESESVDTVQKLLMNNLFCICKRLRGVRKSFLATEWVEGARKLHKPKGETHTHKGDAIKYFLYQEAREETGARRNKIYGTNSI